MVLVPSATKTIIFEGSLPFLYGALKQGPTQMTVWVVKGMQKDYPKPRTRAQQAIPLCSTRYGEPANMMGFGIGLGGFVLLGTPKDRIRILYSG